MLLDQAGAIRMSGEHIHVPDDVFQAVEITPVDQPRAELNQRVPLLIGDRVFVDVKAFELNAEPFFVVSSNP